MAAIPEHLLVTDVLHVSAGTSGRYLWFQPGAGDCDARYACNTGTDIPVTQQQLLSKTAEVGWLLRKVESLTSALAGLQSVVHEALVAAARQEIGNYYRLVAILEAQAQQQAAAGGGGGAAGGAAGAADGVLTLRRLQVWLSEPLGRLRVLAGCLEAAAGVRGGQVINTLHAMSKHGDPLVRKVVSPLLEAACVPYFKQIAQWVLNGAVDASSDEFLVARAQLAPQHAEDPAASWRGGYHLNTAMQPGFISPELAADILTAGKTIAFLREWCGDTRWAAAISTTAEQLATAGGTYQQLR